MATTVLPERAGPVPAPGKPDTRFIGILREAGALGTFIAAAGRSIPHSLVYFSEALRQASMMISGTFAILFLMAMFQGAAIANAGYFLLRAIGAGDFFGLLTAYGDPRFTGQMMFGYVFASKVCCGMTAELGAMKIQQEVDALESTGVDSRSYLVGTRLVGAAMFVPIAFVITYFGVLAGAYFISVTLAGGLSGTVLLSVHWSVQTINDLLFMALIMGIIAAFTAAVACFYGLRTTGGPAAVGSSVARSLVVNLTAIHFIAAAGSTLMYGIDQRLPVGG